MQRRCKIFQPAFDFRPIDLGILPEQASDIFQITGTSGHDLVNHEIFKRSKANLGVAYHHALGTLQSHGLVR